MGLMESLDIQYAGEVEREREKEKSRDKKSKRGKRGNEFVFVVVLSIRSRIGHKDMR